MPYLQLAYVNKLTSTVPLLKTTQFDGKGVGLVATKAIRAGQKVFEEDPYVVASMPGQTSHCSECLVPLTSFQELLNNTPCTFCSTNNFEVANQAEYQGLAKKIEDKFPPHQSNSVCEKCSTRLNHPENQWRDRTRFVYILIDKCCPTCTPSSTVKNQSMETNPKQSLY